MSESQEDQRHPSVDSLPQTGLRVSEAELVWGRNDGYQKRWRLQEIDSFQVGRSLNPLSMAMIGSACAILYVRWAFKFGFLFGALVYLLIGALGLLGLLLILAPSLRFVHRGVQRVKIVCDESREDVSGFVEFLEKCKGIHKDN